MDSIKYALHTCLEANVSNIYVIDDAYTPTSAIYTDDETASLLQALKKAGTAIRYNNKLDEEEIQTEIVVRMPPDCYMVRGSFTKNLEEVRTNYKDYDAFAVAPQISLPFSLFNGLIFALFLFDWIRSVIHRFKIYQNTFVVFEVVNRRLGHPSLPRDSWFKSASRCSYSYGGAGTCLRPTKSGLSYFLYLCYSHASMGVGSLVLLLWVYALIVGFPFYNWIPVVAHYIETKGGEVFTTARILVWVGHALVSILLVNRYFASEHGSLDQLHWVMALTVPFWLMPAFPLMLYYGIFVYRGYRPPPLPPSFKLPRLHPLEKESIGVTEANETTGDIDKDDAE